MRPTPTPTLIRAPAPEPRGRRPAPPTLVPAALDDQTLLALILERMDPETDPARLAAALLKRSAFIRRRPSLYTGREVEAARHLWRGSVP